MEQHLRDLGSAELWIESLERSQKRRTLAVDGRRRMARKKQASGAVTAAMLLTPVLQVGGAMAGSKGRSEVAQSSPANRAIDGRTLHVVLEEGDTGARVAQLQQLLGVDADGIFGPRTASAVRAFQARSGLAVDGVVGASTWRALLGSSPTKGAAADAVVEGKGYQVTVSRASKAESEIVGDTGAKTGPVAKIVLTTAAKPAADPEPVSKSGSGAGADSSSEEKSKPRKHRRHHSVAGLVKTPEEPAADSSPEPATQPAVDTGDAERVSCGSGRLTMPVKGTRTSPFGPRGGRNHDGVDIAAPTGTPVHAAACGVVTTMGVQSGYGNIICVDHGGGFTTCYAHLSGFHTHRGAQVHAGDLIGYVGSTGHSTGPHLHFETRVNGQARNPDPYLNGSQRAPGSHSKTSRVAAKSSASAAPASAGGASTSGGTTAPSSAPVEQEQAAAAPEQAAPAPAPVEQAPVEQAAPAPAPVEQAPVEQAAPAPAPVEQAPVEQAAPAPAPVEEAAPAPAAVEQAPVEQAAPASAEQPAPTPAPTEAPAAPAAEAPAAPQAEAPAPAEPVAAPAAG